MTDTENSDDERYANESFENESDTEVQEMTELESESTQTSEEDGDGEDLPSVKINTAAIKRNSYCNTFTSLNQTDAIPFASSSDEENDVIVGQTMAEINTPSMIFEDELPVPAKRYLKQLERETSAAAEEETTESSEEISEEENDEEEELKKIKDIEEKYLQQMMATTPKQNNIERNESLQEEQQANIQEISEYETESENENDDKDEDEDETEATTAAQVLQKTHRENDTTLTAEKLLDKDLFANERAACSISSSTNSNELENNTIETIDQTHFIQLVQNYLKNLKIVSTNDTENDKILQMCQANLLHEINAQNLNITNIINPEQIALAVVNALKSAGVANNKLEAKEQNQPVINNFNENGKVVEKSAKDVTGQELQEFEVVETQADNSNNEDEHNIYYNAHFDYNITSKTPTSFNSDDYVFHTNFIKRTNSNDKLRLKPHPRKSMSFSNERMREIDRHNQILLRKILTQKPTYTHKNKSSQYSMQKLPSETNIRLTTSAVNRKKQRRQIDLDNQVLKRKLEAIALRKRPVVS